MDVGLTHAHGKPRCSRRERMARTAQPCYNDFAADNQGSLRQGMPEVTPVEIRAAVGHSAQEPAEATQERFMPRLSAVGISGLEAGEDVKFFYPLSYVDDIPKRP